jgi:beta-glucosidase
LTTTPASQSTTGPTDAALAELVGRLDLKHKVRLLTGASFWTLHAEPSIGLDTIVVSDGPAGVRGQSWDERDRSASLPSPTAMAAGWDLDRVRSLGRLIASEARRKGVGVVLGPTINIQRSPRGGRHFEQFSEDPWLSGVLGSTYVGAVQGQGVATSPKHYVANDSETDRMSVDVSVDERTLREVYLAPFERAVTEAGAWLVMSSYNSVGGATMTESPLLEDPLKTEWGFDGVVISDWTAVRDTVGAGKAAQDLTMPGPDGVWGQALVDAVRAGKVSETDVDAKLVRLLRLAGRIGALDGVPAATDAPEPWAREDVEALLRSAAADGMVLARNEQVLPIPPQSISSIAVVGQQAVASRTQGGGSATVFPDHVVSALDGLRGAYGEDSVRYAPGVASADPLMPLEARTATDPISGEPGVRVRFRDGSGDLVLEEHRDGGNLTWLGDRILDRTAAIEVRSRFTAPADGTYSFGFSGIGEFTFTLDGEQLKDGLFMPEGTDPFMAFLAPPSCTFPRTLQAGETVELTLVHRPDTQAGPTMVAFTLGVEEPFGDPAEEMRRAVRTASEADATIVVVGTNNRIESEGFDRKSLRLPEGQDELVEAVLEANPRTLVVVNSGSPVVMPWFQKAPAVLLTWFPGQEFGRALGDVVTGDREPGGRVPTTWAAREDDVPVWQVEPSEGRLFYDEGLNVGYREWVRRQDAGGPAPAISFGHGLGYTSWHLDEASIDENRRIHGRVTNTGEREGKYVLQAYVSRTSPSEVERPSLWLAGFATVHADAGHQADVEIQLEDRSFQHWSVEQGRWETEPGTYSVHLGTAVDELVWDGTVGIDARTMTE